MVRLSNFTIGNTVRSLGDVKKLLTRLSRST
jgi:hypothetical protein